MNDHEKSEGKANEAVNEAGVGSPEHAPADVEVTAVVGEEAPAEPSGLQEQEALAAKPEAPSTVNERLVDAELEDATVETVQVQQTQAEVQQTQAEVQQTQAEVVQAEPGALEVARAESAKLREQMLRIAADFDNYRKRARRESEDGARRAREELLRELLPVFDNMERATLHAEQARDAAAVAEGVKMVVKQFQDTLGKLGVQRLKSVGEVFDPNVHEAIQQVETADQEPGSVAAEVLPGYLWGERLLRAAMVVVAKAPSVAPTPVPQEEAKQGESV